MRKLILLLPALVFTLMTTAKEINIAPNSPHSANNLIAALSSSSTEDGDVIILADGIYSENNNYITFNKNIEVRAAEGAHPIVEVECYIKVENNKNVKISGINFDGSKQDDTGINPTSYSHFMRIYSAGTLELENCEFYNTGSNQVIEVESTSHIDFLKISNCYFHDGHNSAIYIAPGSSAHACDKLHITNSTFANFTGVSDALIRMNTKGEDFAADPAEDAELLVDHCTFYNYIKTSDNTYGFIDSRKSTKVAISNCIIVNPDVTGGTYAMATQTYGGTVANCLDFGTKGHRLTCTNRLNVDPQFNDLANNKYTYIGEYPSNISPARGAATDGSDLGDPRWYTEIVYPTTDFATPYAFVAEDAELEGVGSQFLLETSVTPNYIRYADKADPGTATWYFTATRECYVQVTLNLADNTAFYANNKHILEVQLYEGNNLLGSVAEGPAWEGDGFTENGVDKTLTGHLHIPAAGNYSVKLLNNRHNSKTGIYGVTFSYAGGALVNLPAVAIPFEDAILNGATRDGDGIHFGAVDRYAEWNVAATAGLYTFTFDVVGSNYGHYQLTIIDSESNTIYDNYKGQSASGSVTHSSIYLDGNYTIRVANTNPGADGYITSIAATAASDIFVLDENTTEDGSVAAKDGAHWRLMLRRTFSAGKYYSICIPIDSYDSELTNIFGTGYELWAMESAILNGEEISLNFTQITDGGFAAGKPYLIKPTQDVVNPTFSSHTIHNYTSNNVQSFAAADFIGSFYKTVIPAGESNLYLQNNTLYYSETNNTPIKGTRAWIQLKQSGSLAPARARIVLQNQVVTDIQLAEQEENKAIKTIENGQLIIIRDGVRYNAMGVVMK